MTKHPATGKFLVPAAAFAALVATIVLAKTLFGQKYVLAVSAAAMLWIPLALDRRSARVLRFDPEGLRRGAGVSLAVLAFYVAGCFVAAAFLGKTVEFRALSPSLVLAHLAAVAFPEEFFFRGYLQRTLGGGFAAVVAASVLFALAHFLAICAVSGGGACVQNVLTFFPSLVMGYLYMKTGTLWSSVFFHFAANVVYLSMRFSPG